MEDDIKPLHAGHFTYISSSFDAADRSPGHARHGQEARRVLADGPKTLAEMNPGGVERFKDRLCDTCENPIMSHWVFEDNDPELMGLYWCSKEKTQYSEGLKI